MAHATARSSSKECAPPPSPARIWWSNGIFFVAMHLAAVVAVALRPPSQVPRATLVFMVVMWQAASMGITVGYHRLYSHRAFRATWPARAFLAILGAGGFQGSIKWWCLRHRLHHRFTDDPAHDPYAATKGLLWSHMGWIFYKSRYEKLESIDRDDLEDDIVVRLQHEYYIPLALLTGFVMPPVVGLLWSDPVGSFVYAGLVARLLIWHCTFFVNSLAHWDGLQPYSDDNTSKSNLVLALLTCGEGNHNFHSFPHDFRSGPSSLDWDPSKWAIMLLHSIGLASGLRRAELEEIKAAREHMLEKEAARMSADAFVSGDAEVGDEGEAESTKWDGPIWTAEQAAEYANTKHRCVLLLDGYAVDATEYLAEHPGGTALLRRYTIGSKAPKRDAPLPRGPARDADWAFHGGINKHSQAARRRMRRLRVAKVQD
ncbi:fatty acid desaturase-domain-containing protein [Trametes elegans]|nr:fatty acid desaturase-domain-containing protein [Trametes elegans]